MKNQITILVVDDEPTMRSLLETILSRDGYRILLASDGKEALEVLAREDVEMVISDVNMPRLDGFGLLKIVKNEYPGTSMVMMTGYGDTYTVKDALLLGADEYISKPFRSQEIALVIERAYWRMMSAQGKNARNVPEY